MCIDESNDHVAYLFDWEKGTKLAEMNVCISELICMKPVERPVSEERP